MKQLITLVLVLFFTNTVFASPLCKVLRNDEKINTIYSKQLKKDIWFSTQEVDWLIKFSQFNEITDNADRPVTNFYQVRQVFQNSNADLQLSLVQDRKTKKFYVYVWIYPGGNEYGVFMTPKKKEIIGEVQDGDLYIGSTYCPGLSTEDDE